MAMIVKKINLVMMDCIMLRQQLIHSAIIKYLLLKDLIGMILPQKNIIKLGLFISQTT